jgi:hypothetical protein
MTDLRRNIPINNWICPSASCGCKRIEIQRSSTKRIIRIRKYFLIDVKL